MKTLDNGCPDSPEKESQSETWLSRALARRWRRAAVVMMAALVTGCSGLASEQDESEVGTRSQDLHPNWWRSWSGALTTSASYSSEPAVCSNGIPGAVYVVRNGDDRYYVREMLTALAPSWKVFDSGTNPRYFTSPPSCVMEHPAGTVPQPSGLPLFLIAGKSENKVFVIEAEMQPGNALGEPENPNWTGPWAQVSSTTYSGQNGYPALGSNGAMVVATFMNEHRIYAHTRALPYSGNNNTWGARITGPRLPAAVGMPVAAPAYNPVPGITYMGGAHNKFLMMVRATNSSGVGSLYYITFNGTSFGSWQGPAFIQPHVANSDPALEYDHDYDALSVYFRSGNRIKHTSVINPGDIGVHPIWTIDEGTNTSMFGAPRVIWGGGTEGDRTIVVRGYIASGPTATPLADRWKTVLANAGVPGHDPWEAE